MIFPYRNNNCSNKQGRIIIVISLKSFLNLPVRRITNVVLHDVHVPLFNDFFSVMYNLTYWY